MSLITCFHLHDRPTPITCLGDTIRIDSVCVALNRIHLFLENDHYPLANGSLPHFCAVFFCELYAQHVNTVVFFSDDDTGQP
jgi:hypothetical protein